MGHRGAKRQKASSQKFTEAPATKAFPALAHETSDSGSLRYSPQLHDHIPVQSDCVQVNTTPVSSRVNQRGSRVLETPKSTTDLPESGMLNADVVVNF